MATKEKKSDRPKPTVTEQDKVNGWRKEQFTRMLPGMDEKRIDDLVSSTSTPHDLQKLLGKECPPDLAIKILV